MRIEPKILRTFARRSMTNSGRRQRSNRGSWGTAYATTAPTNNRNMVTAFVTIHLSRCKAHNNTRSETQR